MVIDDRVPTYLRGQAVQAAAKIGPGEAKVIEAFIQALDNPNPKTESGVHDRVIQVLGEMGKAARPAKKSLEKMLDHPWYQDYAYVALGKLSLAVDTPSVRTCFARLRKIEKTTVEETSAAFLGLARVKQSEVSAEVRTLLWDIVEARKNDLCSRAAMRTLIELGPESSLRGARLITRNMFLPFEPRQGDMVLLAERALATFEAKEKAAAEVFARGLAKAIEPKRNWTTAMYFTRALTKFGKDARPAVPQLIQGLRGVKGYQPNAYTRDLLEAYTDALGGLDGDVPGVRQVILDLLNPESRLMKESGPYAWIVEARLLGTLARLGVPGEGSQRELSWKRVRSGLKSDQGLVFHDAALVIKKSPRLNAKEARELVSLLARVLPFDFKFPLTKAKEPSPITGVDIHGAQLAAVEALAAVGPNAANALPILNAWAKRQPEPVRSVYLPEPPVNRTIRAARQAIEKMKGE
jgi:hypothetical protein